MINNMHDFLNFLSPEEKKVLSDPSTVIAALNNPILKLLIIEKPQELLNLKHSNNGTTLMLHLDGNKDVFINSFTTQVIKAF